MGSKCIGIDIGGTTVKIGIFTTEGQLLEKWEVPTRKENNGNQILPDVAASIEKKLQKMGIDKADVVGAGMGVPGPVLPDGSVEVCVNLGWKNANPQKELSGLLGGMLVRSGNDANVAALGEMWQGGGKGYRDIVMVTLGTGVGGGVIIDEKIIAGRHGLAGEIGHIHVRDEETEYCNCGGRGCLEQVASATGIAREARRALAADETPSAMRRFEDHISAKNVLDCAKSGDALALQVTETVGRYLGLACAQIALTVDPEAFVIGGGVSRAGQFLIDVIQKYYDNYVAISANKGVLTLAKLGNDAGIYGAARAYGKKFLKPGMVQGRSDVRMGEKAFDLGSKNEERFPSGKKQRLYPGPVPCQKQTFPGAVGNGQSKDAVHPFYKIRTPLQISGKDHFGIAGSSKLPAFLFQFFFQLGSIIKFPVVGDNGGAMAGFFYHRLPAAGRVNNGQTGVG